ncbi:MAG: PilZ domain-containing protein [Desulfocapsaceae bacterium]|nr:PilZ domain-containing protein [Desulfocapsaceae bacterium]
MEKRKYPRIEIKKLSVDVSDGIGFFPGVVSDISRSGICIQDLSERLNGKVKKMVIVVSSQDEHFKMNVRPKWSLKSGLNTSLGVEIVTVPLGWTEFVINVEPIFTNTIWGEVRL